MGQYSSLIIGGIVMLLGFLGVIGWWADFVSMLKGLLPVFLICGGLIAMVAGASEIRDKQNSKKETAK